MDFTLSDTIQPGNIIYPPRTLSSSVFLPTSFCRLLSFSEVVSFEAEGGLVGLF